MGCRWHATRISGLPGDAQGPAGCRRLPAHIPIRGQNARTSRARLRHAEGFPTVLTPPVPLVTVNVFRRPIRSGEGLGFPNFPYIQASAGSETDTRKMHRARGMAAPPLVAHDLLHGLYEKCAEEGIRSPPYIRLLQRAGRPACSLAPPPQIILAHQYHTLQCYYTIISYTICIMLYVYYTVILQLPMSHQC